MEAVALSDSLLKRDAKPSPDSQERDRRKEQQSHSNSFCSCRPYLHGVQARILGIELSVAPLPQCFLKNCTSRSCCRAF
jgi:hypothetical protein